MRKPTTFVEVLLRDPLDLYDPNELVVTLSKDSLGRWWHTVGGEVIRTATTMEVVIAHTSMATWQSLGTPAKESA